MEHKDAKPVIWLGVSRKQVQAFPQAVRHDIGSALYDAQLGITPPLAKPLKGVGSGIFEIVTRFDTNTYRTVYAVQMGNHVYVLHAFQKKSPKGRKTARKDIEMIERRHKEAMNIAKEKLS
jgi:phage-related protein